MGVPQTGHRRGRRYGFFFPLANYVSSEPAFYLLRAAGPMSVLRGVALPA